MTETVSMRGDSQLPVSPSLTSWLPGSKAISKQGEIQRSELKILPLDIPKTDITSSKIAIVELNSNNFRGLPLPVQHRSRLIDNSQVTTIDLSLADGLTRVETVSNSVSTVLSSLRQIKQAVESVRLLCLLSYLDGHSIPDLLWTTDSRFRDSKLRVQFSTATSLDSIIRPLVDYSLVRRCSSVARSISMESSVQAFMRSLLQRSTDGENELSPFLTAEERTPVYWAERAIELMNIACPMLTQEFPVACAALLANIRCCLEFGRQHHIMTLDLASLQYSLACYLSEQKAYEESCRIFEAALQTQASIFNFNHPSMVPILNNLGVTYGNIQRYDEALKVLQQSLCIAQTSFGPDPTPVADVLVNLGLTYCAMGKYGEAISRYQAARTIREKCANPDHLKFTETYGALGEAYFKMARFEAAIEWCQRALAIPITGVKGFPAKQVRAMETLARSYTALGKYDSAMDIYEKVLDVNLRFPPGDDIDMADTIHNMGVTLQGLCKFDQAIEAFKKALQTYVGKDDAVRIANATKNIGVVYSAQGRHDTAIAYFKRALGIERHVGLVGLSTANTMNNLGVAYARVGLLMEAMAQYEGALKIVRSLHGSEWHVDVADLLYNIGVTRATLGKLKSAKKDLKQSIHIFVLCLGEQHAKSLRARKFARSLSQQLNMKSRKFRKRSYRHFRRRF